MWPIGTLVGIILIVIAFGVVWWIISSIASVFSYAGLIATMVLFGMQWLLWGAISDADRDAWGKYLWALPFVALGIGVVGKATGIVNQLDFMIAQMDRPMSFHATLATLPVTVQVGQVGLTLTVLLAVMAVGAILLSQDNN